MTNKEKELLIRMIANVDDLISYLSDQQRFTSTTQKVINRIDEIYEKLLQGEK